MSSHWKRLEHGVLKPWLRRVTRPIRRFDIWRQADLAGVRIHYKKHLDGGGLTFGRDFIPFLQKCGMPKQPRVFEWCAGPGFIGFSILGHGLCDTLALADINPEAVEACQRTVANNNLDGRVAVYHSDNLSGIPATEQWDLVVSNPPHFVDEFEGQIRSYDKDWHIHRGFFQAIGKFLKPGGVILLQENNRGSSAETFRAMIEAAGLDIIFTHGEEPERTSDYRRFYFTGIMRRGDTRPAWTQKAGQPSPN